MKKVLLIVMAMIWTIGLVLVNTAAIAAPAQAIKLTYADPSPATADQSWAKTGKPWSEAVKKRWDGKFELETFFGGSLVSNRNDVPKTVGKGMADIGASMTSNNPSEFPMDIIGNIAHPNIRLGGVEITMMGRILFAEIPGFEEQCTKNNLKRLFIVASAGLQIACKKPINTLADFKGIKIRTFGTNVPKMLQVVGAVPVAMAFHDVLEALDKGVIDAGISNPLSIRDLKWNEVAPHIILLGEKGIPPLLDAGYQYNINLDTWKKLPQDLRRIMLEEGKKVELEYSKYSAEETGKAIKYIQGKGAILHTLSEADLKKWGELCPDFLSDTAKALDAKGLPGTKTVSRLRELAAMSTKDLTSLWEKAWEKEFASIK